ncbi:MAG: tRNA pseudouridine(38-40) synthase TruA, partial [Desulfobacterales bacterium]|nr:tRNA pseudouridine(38-40) synthase TruA [Desulfobacterales bacterium]
FLRFMVRNIVGTLVDVGLGKNTAKDFKRILLSKDRNLAGVTAPPQGLFLMQVNY